MIVARWHIDARFGHKRDVIESLETWFKTFGVEIGWTPDRVRLTTGSVGAAESLVVSEVTLDDLSALDASWNKLATLDGHAAWSRELEPHVVPGSNRWEVLRVL